MLLEVRGMSKEYEKGLRVLSEVSFSVDKGEFLSVIGPSGSGKSTLLRCINRMIDSTEGEIIFEGIHIETLKKKEINKVSKAKIILKILFFIILFFNIQSFVVKLDCQI